MKTYWGGGLKIGHDLFFHYHFPFIIRYSRKCGKNVRLAPKNITRN